jgi:lipoprotein-releasing system permease protein
MFWSLMSLHGVSYGTMVWVFSVFSLGLIVVTVLCSIPLGIMIASSIDPLVHAIESMTNQKILSPEFFVLDYIPYQINLSDIVVVEGLVCVMAIFFTFLALRRLSRVDVMLVVRNG